MREFAKFAADGTPLYWVGSRLDFYDQTLSIQKDFNMSDINQLINAITSLGAAEKGALLAKLQDVSASASKEAVEKQRLSAIRAAANDPARAVAFKSSLKGLERLGLSLEKIAASDDALRDLNRAMSENRWQMFERVQLKTSLAGIGAIE